MKNHVSVNQAHPCSQRDLCKKNKRTMMTQGTSPLRFTVLLTLIAVAVSSSSYRNVYGNALESCSTDGMALTGYTRTGYCVDQNDDAGSHHICIDLSTLPQNNNQNFCQVTGQSNWCASDDMPCHENASSSSCSIQHWCVCQWAFASYMEAAGGCNAIQDVVCAAVNEQALIAYQQQANLNSKYQRALECLVERCGLANATNQVQSVSSLSTQSPNAQNNARQAEVVVVVFLVAGLALAAFFWNNKNYNESRSNSRYHDPKSSSMHMKEHLMD